MYEKKVNVKVLKVASRLVITNDRNAVWDIPISDSSRISHFLSSMVGTSVAEFFNGMDKNEDTIIFSLTLKKL